MYLVQTSEKGCVISIQYLENQHSLIKGQYSLGGYYTWLRVSVTCVALGRSHCYRWYEYRNELTGSDFILFFVLVG
jgi:hypothetical protein